MDCIIFGGAFDPPHNAHIKCVKLTHQAFPESKLVILPAYQPPSSEREQTGLIAGQKPKQTQLSFEERLHLCKLAFLEENSVLSFVDKIEVSSLEGELEKPSYTVNTVRHLAKIFPVKKFAWLVGEDQLVHFPAWNSPEEILKLVSLIVIPRVSNRDSQTIEQSLFAMSATLGLKLETGETKNCYKIKETGKHIYLIQEQAGDISSRSIRVKRQRDQQWPKEELPRRVWEYLAQFA